jgi:hypothetical protein
MLRRSTACLVMRTGLDGGLHGTFEPLQSAGVHPGKEKCDDHLMAMLASVHLPLLKWFPTPQMRRAMSKTIPERTLDETLRGDSHNSSDRGS